MEEASDENQAAASPKFDYDETATKIDAYLHSRCHLNMRHPPNDQHLDKNWKTRKRVQVKGRGMTKVSIVQVHGILHEMFQDIILS